MAIATVSVIGSGAAIHLRGRSSRSDSSALPPAPSTSDRAIPQDDSIALGAVENPSNVIELIAELRPIRDAVILADARGRVTTIADEGDTIRAGGIVARLEGSRSATPIEPADASLRKAEAELAQKRRALERSERLLAAGGISRREHEAAQNAAESAERTLADLRESRRAPVTPREANVIRAPFDALILEANVRRGAAVSPGTPLLRLAEISTMEVAASIGGDDARRVAAGDSVTIVFEDDPGETYVTVIERVDRGAAGVERAGEIVALLLNREMTLTAGRIGRMRITPGARAR